MSIDLIPGQPIEITFDYPAAQITRGPGTIVFNFPDGGQLIVHGWDAAAAASPEASVKLPDEAQATIAEIKDLFDAIAVAPAAGPGAESTGGPANTGAAFTPYDPGNIGAGLNDLGPLGFGELAYRVPELAPRITDQLLTLSAPGGGGSATGPSEGPPILSVSDVTVTEGQVAGFVVSLSGPSAGPVSVNYSFVNGSAQAPADFIGSTGTLVFLPGGPLSQTIQVPTIADGTFEGPEGFTLVLSDPNGAVVPDPTGNGTIVDSDTPPAIIINDVVVNEGGQAVFTVSLTDASATPVTVNFTTANGTAVAPADYAAANGTITFAPGVTTQTITIGTVADGVPEGNETFVVNLSNPTGATVADPQGTGTIIDSGSPPPAIVIDDVTVTEGGTAVFTVSLSSPSATPVTVSFASGDGSAVAPGDYGATSGTITFAPGVTTQTVTVPTVADGIVEGTESYFINLSNPDGATIADNQGLGTIIEPVVTPPTLSIDDVTVLEGNSAVFTVSLSAASATPVTVTFGSHDGTAGAPGDYGAVGGTITFAPGVTTQTVTVGTVDDGVFEGSESYTIDLSNAVGATIADGQGVGTIIDNEAPLTITIDDVTVFEGDTAVFTVSLSGPSATPVTVHYGSSDGSANAPGDYGSVGGTVTFAPGETTQTIVVNTVEDTLSEGTESYYIDLSSATGATIADGQGVGTIIDDEGGLEIIINDVTVMEGGTAVFTVSLSGATGLPVTVQFATGDGTAGAPGDYTAGSGTITFLPGGALTQTISVPTVQDQVPEGTENFVVNLSNATNAVIADDQGLGTILDNDALPGILINDVVVQEGQVATFTVSLTSASAVPVTATFATADGTAIVGADYSGNVGTITFAPGVTTQTIQVTTLNDQITEGSETFLVNLTNINGAVAVDPTGVGTILDNDAVVFSIAGDAQVVEGAVANYTVAYSGTLGDGQTASVVVSTGVAAGGDADATPLLDYVSLAAAGAPGVSFNSATGVLTFTGGAGNATSLAFTVPTVPDSQVEPTEDFQVQLTGPSANASIATPSVVTEILDNDQVTFNITGSTAVLEGNTASYTVSYAGSLAPGVSVSVHVATGVAAGGNPDATPGVDFGDLSAVSGVSFNPATGILTFTGGGATSAGFTVATVDDGAVEPTEDYKVQLSDPSANASIGVGAVTTDIVDTSQVLFNISGPAEVHEGTTASYTIGYDGVLADGVTASIHVATADFAGGNPNATPGVDYGDLAVGSGSGFSALLAAVAAAGPGVSYDADTGVLTFTGGAGNATNIVLDVPTLPDTIVENVEDFQVQLSDPSANAVIGVGSVVTDIIDDDTVTFAITGDATVTEGATANYTVAYTGTLADGVTTSVHVATADFAGGNPNATAIADYLALAAGSAAGVSFNAATGTLTFTGGAGNATSLGFSVPTVNDSTAEPTEDFQVQLSGPSANATITTPAVVTNILDNDQVTFNIAGDTSVTEGNVAVYTVSYAGALGDGVSASVQVALADAPGGSPNATPQLDYFNLLGGTASGVTFNSNTGVLTFTGGAGNATSVTFGVQTAPDTFVENTEDYEVHLANASANAAIGTDTVVTDIIDNDQVTFNISGDNGVIEGNTANYTVSYTGTLAPGISASVHVGTAVAVGGAADATPVLDFGSLAAAAGVAYNAATGILTFTGGGATSASFTVPTVQDTLTENTEDFRVGLSSPSANAAIGIGAVNTLIIDNDHVSFAITGDTSVTEGTTADYTVGYSGTLADGVTASVHVATADFAGGNPNATAAVDYLALAAGSAPGVSFNAATGILTFTGGAGNATSLSFTVPTFDDSEVETTEDFQVQLTGPSANATITTPAVVTNILDNDLHLPPVGTASSPPGPLAATMVDVSIQHNPLGSTAVGDYLLNNNIDGQAINPALVNGVDPQNLTLSVDAEVTVQFVREIAGFHNMVGWYTFDANGHIDPGSVKFIWTDATADVDTNYANLIAADFLGNNQPELVSLGTVAADTHIGFFLVSNGANMSSNVDLLRAAAGEGEGGPNDYADDIGKINAVAGFEIDGGTGNGYVTVNGQRLEGATYFTHDKTLNNDLGTGDDIVHSISGLTSSNDGNLYVGWEDFPGGGDHDYNDVVFRVDIGDYNLNSISGVVWNPVITLSDPDSANLSQMTIMTTGFHVGDTLTIPGLGGFTIGADTDGSANYSVLVTGLHSVGDYQTLADGIYFTLSTASPVEGVRTIELGVTDDTGLTNVNPIVSTFDIVINETISTAANSADSYDLGRGDDKALLSDLSFAHIDGGAGVDTVQPAQIGLNLGSADLAKIDNVEAIDLGGFGNNTVALTPQDVLDVTDSGNVLTVLGDAGDAVDLNPAQWAAPTTVNEGGVLFNQYTATIGAETAILKIEQDVTVS